MAEKENHPKPDHQETVPFGADMVLNIGTGNNGVYQLYNDTTKNLSLEKVVEMRRNDGHARALMQLVLLPLRYALQNGEWVAPENAEGNTDEEVEFANLMWSLPKSGGGMSQPATKIIRQLLLAITDGFAPFEQVYTQAEEGPLKGKWVLGKLSYCDPRTITINTTEDGGFEGFTQRVHTIGGKSKNVRVPKENALVFTYQDELNPYYGVSMFESAYPHYEIRRKLYYIAHLAAQFAAVPGRVGTVPRQATQQQVAEFRNALANFAFNTTMLVREGWTVTPFATNTSFDFLKLIDHHRSMMSKSILAGFFDTEQRTVLIENATQDASADMFLLTLSTIAEDMAATISDYLMPKFIDWNFGTGVYPRFVPAPLTDADKTNIIDVFRNFAMAGTLNCTPEMVREMEKKVSADFDLPIDYEEIEKREKEAAEQQAQQQAEQQAMEAQQAAQGSQVPPDDQEPVQQPSEPVAMSNTGIDDLVAAAQELFSDMGEPVPVDTL